MSNIIVATFTDGCTTAVTEAIYEGDYGMILQFAGLDLPDVYTVNFGNEAVSPLAHSMIGNADGVEIPNQLLTESGHIMAWVFLHTGEDDGETEYAVTIPVLEKMDTQIDDPTPEQESALNQAIAALNAGVERAETAADSAEQIAADLGDFETAMEAVTEAKNSAEQSASDASASAGNAAQSAQNAAQSASSAATSAEGAYASEEASAQSAEDASSSASAAATSATNAAASEAAARAVEESIPADYAALSDDVSDLKSEMGDLADLDTTDKSSLVAAINEAAQSGGGGDITDVQVNGVSVVQDGVANVPAATSTLGVVKTDSARGITTDVNDIGKLIIVAGSEYEIKAGNQLYRPVTPTRQHMSTFYGLAKAAGDTTQSQSSNEVGAYTDEAKAAIQAMLDVPASAEVSDLKSHLDDFKDEIYENVYITNILFKGDVSVSGTGTYVSKDILTLTNFSAGDAFSISADSVVGASNATPFYMYVRNGTTNLNSSTNGIISVTQANIDAGADNVLFRFYPAAGTALSTGTATATGVVIRKTSEIPFALQDVMINAIRRQALSDFLYVNNISTIEYVGKLQSTVLEYKQSRNLVLSWILNTTINSQGTTSASNDYAITAKFPVLPGQKIGFTRSITSTTRGLERFGIIYYKQDGTTVLSSSLSFSSSPRTIPSDAAFAIVEIYNVYAGSAYKPMVEYTDGTDISNEYEKYFTPYWNYRPSGTNRNADKNLCVFGDSLAASGNGGTDTWINRVGNALGFNKVYDRGVGSSRVTEGTDPMYAYVDADGDAYNRGAYTTQQTIPGYTEINACMSGSDRANTIPTDTNVLIILAGANDVGAIGSAGKAQFTSDYKLMLDKIYARVPNALVYLCTMPFHVAFDTGASAKVYEDYREIIREIGHEYGFPVIELKQKMMVNKNNYASFMNTDNVHYNTTAGRNRTAEAVIPYLYGYMYLT